MEFADASPRTTRLPDTTDTATFPESMTRPSRLSIIRGIDPTVCAIRSFIRFLLHVPGYGTKKADVAERPWAFHHVGILFNGPPGKNRAALHLVIRYQPGRSLISQLS